MGKHWRTTMAGLVAIGCAMWIMATKNLDGGMFGAVIGLISTGIGLMASADFKKL